MTLDLFRDPALACWAQQDAGTELEDTSRSLFIKLPVTRGEADMSEFLEIEQKFDVDAGFERPSFAGLAGISEAEPALYHLSATYFDTADERLAAAKITLRRRTG